MTSIIIEVNSLGVQTVEGGKQTEAWTVKTSQGEFGCIDGEAAKAAAANIGESAILHVADPPPGYKLKRLVRVDDSVF